MREIDLYAGDDLDTLPIDTVMVYGDTGTGKTTFSAGFPRPLFLADESEGGWKSLSGLADDQLFEPNVDPIVWAIKEMGDVALAFEKVQPFIACGRVKTIVMSSITFYANTYLANLLRLNPGMDTRQVYGNLGIHLRDVRTRFHALGINVVWEALADHPETGGEGQPSKSGRPSIPGKAADQFAAGVGYLFRAQLDDVRKDGKIIDRVLRLQTQTSGGYLARVRVGKTQRQLPNPLLGGYKGFLQARGYDIDRLRASLPPPVKPNVTISTPAVKPAAVPQKAQSKPTK